MKITTIILAIPLLTLSLPCSAFFSGCHTAIVSNRRGPTVSRYPTRNVVMMSSRKGALGRRMEENSSMWTAVSGITLPEKDRSMKAWELDLNGEALKLTAIRVSGRLFCLEGACSRCSFDLWRGTIIPPDERGTGGKVACPLCGTTYSLNSGVAGAPLERKGLNGWLGGLTQTATIGNAAKGVTPVPVKLPEGGGVLLDLRGIIKARNEQQK